MADELRLIFIIIGALVLGALLIHGLWTVRKNSGQPKHRYYDEKAESQNDNKDGFDDLGVGPVRQVKASEKAAAKLSDLDSSTDALPAHFPKKNDEPVIKTEIQSEFAFDEPVEPAFSLSALDEYDTKKTDSDDVMDKDLTAQTKDSALENNQANDNVSDGPSEVLIVYVLLPEDKEIKGPELLSSLLTLGFKYGDMDIFHRYENSAGTGAVLFSLANMFNPGTFDLENMDKLNTRGVSLFMTLPTAGDALANFNLMHHAAKRIAEEFGGQVLDAQRSVMTVQTVRHYIGKIREFQRQRLIHG